MKRILFPAIVAALILGFLQPRTSAAEVAVASAKTQTPGVALAQALSTITGVAISPLVGVGAIGAWKYYKAAPSARAGLPWYAQPWFWAPALVLVSLITFKDVFGMAVPAVLKKPFDVLETIGHKVSGLVALGAFVPLVASVFQDSGLAPLPGLNAAGYGHGLVAVIDTARLDNGISSAAMMAIFVVVFLASNSINILILLSPFPVVDAVLKAFRLATLGAVSITALANPWLGAAFSLVIVVIAYFIAGWSLRLSHLGLTFVWDFCTRGRRRFTPEKSGNWMFLGREINGVPIRTHGKLIRDTTGNLALDYRPWLVLPQRRLVLPTGIYAVGRGLVNSEIVKVEGDTLGSVMLLPPRYRSHEAKLAQVYGLAGVREAGLRAAFAWLKERLGLRPRLQTIPV